MNTFYAATRTTKEIHSVDPRLIKAHRGSTTPLVEKVYRGLTSPVRLLPDFLVIGAQRGGTTSLYQYLQAHPCIKLTTTKEVHFFDRRFHKGAAWYRGHFPTTVEKAYAQHVQGRAFVAGDVTPDYLFIPHTPYRVAQVLPHTKLIVLLRNPVERAYSHYHLTVELGHEHFPFEEAIRREEERLGTEREKMLKDERYESYAYEHFSYLSRGIYVEQLQAWMQVFPREQFLILKSEDFYRDPPATLKQVFAFLGIPEAQQHLPLNEYKPYNQSSLTPMDAGLREHLRAYFAPHNARLYNYLGVNFGWDS